VTVAGAFDHHQVIHLTTVGRVSGRPHTIEIWFAQHGSTLYMLSGGAQRSDWVRNLSRTPTAKVRAGGRDYPGLGRIVTDPQEVRLARDAVYGKYSVLYRGDLSGWRETALPMAVDLEDPRLEASG
jgi:deazaflavin-dependent oxidoreductase (nitroreductase family)